MKPPGDEYNSGWESLGVGPSVSQLEEDNSLADRNPQGFSSWLQEAISCIQQQSLPPEPTP